MATQSPTGLVRATTESTPKTRSDSDELPLDIVYGMLSNERRRRTLRFLVAETETTLGDLAEHIASIENDKSTDALSSSERKRVYICLYQCHLPKLDDAGVIQFDQNRKTIELAENAEHVREFLPEADDGASGEPGGWTTTVARATRRVGDRLLNGR